MPMGMLGGAVLSLVATKHDEEQSDLNQDDTNKEYSEALPSPTKAERHRRS